MKVLVTGGAGYVGTEVCKELVRSAVVDEIIVYDNLSKSHYNMFLGKQFEHPEKVRFVKGDVLDSRQLIKLMTDTDVVIHLAAIVTTPFANTDPHFYEQVNHWGTAEVVYAAEDSNISKFIYLSSTSVYGSNTNTVADETTAPSPSTFYGISKLRGEEHVNRLKERKNAIVLRGGNVYGYNRSIRFDAVINRFMFDANYSNRIQIFGNGKQTRAFIHVEHLAHSIAKCVTSDVDSGTYNLVDKNLKVLDILDTMKEIYPTLEFIFSNQHMQLRELNVSPETRLFDYISKFSESEFKQELLDFKGRFSF
ncbi:MAG: NAD-dependent epimerase/dehydratase family protein [Cyclobacteriaceae bacterium]